MGNPGLVQSKIDVETMSTCTGCGAEVQWSDDRCPVCGQDVGFPNIREVDTEAEHAALDRRYDSACVDARGRGAEDQLVAFEKAVRESSRAVIALPPSFLANLLQDSRTLYATYQNQVDAGVRRPAQAGDYRRRRAVEGTLFGAYGSQIVYATLALDHYGPKSYGSCTIELADVATRHRATLLEQNSYHFVRTHQMGHGDPIPNGYRAIWTDRHRLAVAKLASQVYPGTQDSKFPTILLFSGTTRDKDEFIEVHVYGKLDNQAIEAVATPRPSNAEKPDDNDIKRIREWAQGSGMICNIL